MADMLRSRAAPSPSENLDFMCPPVCNLASLTTQGQPPGTRLWAPTTAPSAHDAKSLLSRRDRDGPVSLGRVPPATDCALGYAFLEVAVTDLSVRAGRVARPGLTL